MKKNIYFYAALVKKQAKPMKLLAPLALIALMAVTALSCSKEESVNNGSNSKNRIKTYTEAVNIPGVFQYSETFNLFYDDKNRVTRMQSTTRPDTKFEYTYSSDHFVMEIIVSGQMSIHNTFYLNGNSLVDSSVQYDNNHDTTVTKYVYNNNKQLIQQRIYTYTTIMGASLDEMINYTYDANGLMIKEIDADGETTYKYEKVINNNVNIGAPYMPLPVRLPTQTIHESGGDTETIDYTYNFDSSNRLISQLAVSSEGGTSTLTYTYY
jgi:hypothetical protein